jgi:hypothetical protein
MRKPRFFGPFAFMAACAAAIWLYFTPHLAVKRMQDAARAGDHQALAQLVDFPAVRASVKEEVREAVSGELGADRSPLASFGAALAGMVVEPLVDSFVTPEGIASAVRGERPSLGSGEKRVKKEARDLEVARGYEGSDTFVLHFRDRDDGTERMALVMRRHGIADWKLAAIRLPGGDMAK